MSEAGDRLTKALEESVRWMRSLSDEEREKIMDAQRRSFVSSQMNWPKPRYEWINGVKVYASFEDYCND